MKDGSLFFPPKGNRCKLFDSPSPCSSTQRSMLKRPDRSQEESPPGNTKRRKSMARASPEAAASPEKPPQVGSVASFVAEGRSAVCSSSKISIGFFVFAETCFLFLICFKHVCDCLLKRVYENCFKILR